MSDQLHPLYGLVFGNPAQREIIDAHCFKTCGQIIVGAVYAGEAAGALLVCRTPAAKCPHFDKEMLEPMGKVRGDPIFLRKLKKESPRG